MKRVLMAASAAFFLFAVAGLPGCGATNFMTSTSSTVNGALNTVDAIAIPDLQNALTDAQANDDEVAAECWGRLLKFVQSRQQARQADGALGLASGLQGARDLSRSNIKEFCAPLAIGTFNGLAGVFAKLGGI